MKGMLVSLLVLFSAFTFAAPGDTIKVQSHDRVHMNWNGNYDRTAEFPEANKKFRKIWLHYTLGCPDKGCSEWDYTTLIYARRPTGRLDSSLRNTPNFRVDGSARDSFYYNTTATYSYFWDGSAMDSTMNASVELMLFTDAQNPQVATDTLEVWDAMIYRPEYDGMGNQVDSAMIEVENMIYRNDLQYYQVFEVIENLELARVITPYAGDKDKNWSHTYSFDITDYAPVLRDSTEIRARFSGWQDGFTVTLDFEFIEGTPALEPYAVLPMWVGSFPYGNPNNSIENYLTEQEFDADTNFNEAKLRIIQTGHGFGGNENCAEFCPKDHYIKVNGDTKWTTTVWRDNCGLNPLYPQTGTWLYDRANWCPGSAVEPYDYYLGDILKKGEVNTIDMDMEAFTNNGNNSCSYTVSGLLFLYKDNGIQIDASLEEILAPNNHDRHNRYNPICGEPKVRIRNNGKQTIQSVQFKYGVKGGEIMDWTWFGTLEAYQEKEITLFAPDWTGASVGRFEVEIVGVNGAPDEEALNNARSSQFELTDELPSQFMIWVKANNRPSDNKMEIRNVAGDIVFKRDQFTAATWNRDTVSLEAGCYIFEFTDETKNGLSFWAQPSEGSGILILRAMAGFQLRSFEPDFGTSHRFAFTVGHPLGQERIGSKAPELNVYPNPAQDEVDLAFDVQGAYEYTITDLNGKTLIHKSGNGQGLTYARESVGNLANGVYLIRLRTAYGEKVQKLIIRH